MAKLLEKTVNEAFLVSIALPRLIFFDPENNKTPLLTGGLLFCPEKGDFFPIWIKVCFRFDFLDKLRKMGFPDQGIPPGSEIEDKFPFRGYRALIKVEKSDPLEKGGQAKIFLKSIKVYD